MVNIAEVKVMFWGLTLESEKRYTQEVKTSFHISMAALEPSQDPKADSHVSVLIQHSGCEYLLCTLGKKGPLQQPLDLNFIEDEEVTFFLTGKGRVHLTGYLAPEEDFMTPDEEDEDEISDQEVIDLEDSDSEEEDIPKLQSLMYGSDEDSDEESDEEELNGKRKKKQAQPSKKARLLLEEEAEEEDDSDEDESELDDADLDELMRSYENDGEDEEDEESDEEESFIAKPTKGRQSGKKETPKDKKKQEAKKTPKSASKTEVNKTKSGDTPKAASLKNAKKSPSEKKVNASVPDTPMSSDVADTPGDSEKKKKKKKKKNKGQENGETPKQQGENSAQTTPVSVKKKKQVLEGGVIVEEVKEGHGPAATPGKMMGMYYIGKLHNNQKEFDRTMGGTPFKFKLGKGEVIKGWDVGVKGMKVGGKRRITVPPKMGYGSQKQGPIPSNSTLVFDVELKSVS